MSDRLKAGAGWLPVAAALGVALYCAAMAWGQPITGPAEIKEHAVGVFTVPENGQLLVEVPDGLSVEKRPGEWFVAGKPGAYQWKGYWIDFDNRKADVVSHPFVIVGDKPPEPGPGPEPRPRPEPGPEPQPGPVTPSKLFVVIVEETQDKAAGRGAMLADPAVAERFREKGHQWRVVDKDVVGPDGKPPADITPYLSRAKGKAYPQVFLVDADGNLRFQGDAPAGAGDLLKLLDNHGG
jgi:hypothetical protein